MEVLLKKSKITSSILKQTLIASFSNLKTYDVIGFCVVKGDKWIVLYESSTKEIRKFLMFKDVVIEVENKPDGQGNLEELFYVVVKFEGRYLNKKFISTDKSEAEESLTLFNDIKLKAKTKGQFFI
jgi:hypothetical protein